MNVEESLYLILLGAAAGLFGQAIRVIPGMKKAMDDAKDAGKTLAEVFSGWTLVFSLLIGASAGVVAALTLGIDAKAPIAMTTISGLMAAGYAGADFLEGFAKRHLPK